MGIYDDWTFEVNDKLDRKDLAQVLTKILKKGNSVEPERNSFVLAINSKWGTGKTAFVKMWINMLKNTEANSLELIYLNVSQDEEFGDPIIPLVSSIYSKTKIESLKDAAGNIPDILVDIIESKVGANLKDLTKNDIDSLLDKYSKFQSKKYELKEILNNYTDKNQVIIFIDELDRCSCSYVLKYLEIIKTYFDVKDLNFVLTIDLEQLSNLISSAYNGFENANKYLTKFYDLLIEIPEPKIEQYFEHLHMIYFNKEDLEFRNLYLRQVYSFKNEIISNLKKMNATLRDMNFIFRYFMLYLSFYGDLDKGSGDLLVYFYIIMLKQIKPEYLENILLDYITKTEKIAVYENSNYEGTLKEIIEYWITGGFSLTLRSLNEMNRNGDDLTKIYNDIGFHLTTGGSDDWELGETIGQFIKKKLALLDLVK